MWALLRPARTAGQAPAGMSLHAAAEPRSRNLHIRPTRRGAYRWRRRNTEGSVIYWATQYTEKLAPELHTVVPGCPKNMLSAAVGPPSSPVALAEL